LKAYEALQEQQGLILHEAITQPMENAIKTTKPYVAK
jgi:hypothetical protein